MLIHLQYTVFYAHILLHWDSFTRKHFYTEAFWHTHTQWQSRLHANTFTRRCSFCARFSLHARKLCHRDAFDHTCFYTEIFLHGDTFAKREMPFLHTNTFTERWFYTGQFLHRNQNKQRCFYKGMHVHEGFLAMGIFTQTYYWIISCGGHVYGAKSSASICKITVSPQLLRVETHFVEKGWPRTNPHCNLTSMHDDRHFVRTGCVSWTSIHVALPLEEKS